MAKPNVLITGSGIGIGRDTALAFSRAGYVVIATDILDREGAPGRRGDPQGGRRRRNFFHLDVTEYRSGR